MSNIFSDLAQNYFQNFSRKPIDVADKYGIMKAQEKERRKEMKKFYGSDDGYDYQKDNRNGEVDAYVAFVMEWKKKQEDKKKETK